jgi:hypothetical protein
MRHSGTLSLAGVYGGMADPLPCRGCRQAGPLRMGQANIHRWAPEILPLLTEEDPLGTQDSRRITCR